MTGHAKPSRSNSDTDAIASRLRRGPARQSRPSQCGINHLSEDPERAAQAVPHAGAHVGWAAHPSSRPTDPPTVTRGRAPGTSSPPDTGSRGCPGPAHNRSEMGSIPTTWTEKSPFATT
jgi:hypothetical protein